MYGGGEGDDERLRRVNSAAKRDFFGAESISEARGASEMRVEYRGGASIDSVSMGVSNKFANPMSREGRQMAAGGAVRVVVVFISENEEPNGDGAVTVWKTAKALADEVWYEGEDILV